jgi:AAA domain
LTDLPNDHDDGNQSDGDAFDTTVIDILEGRLLLEQLRPKTGGDPPPATQAKKRVLRRGAKFIALADVRPQPVRWLWPDRIACKLVLFTGLPDCGKTTAAIDIASRVTMGEVWPDGSGLAPHGSVLILTAEDGLADTIRTRADAAGADVRRIYVLTGVHDERGNPSSFELQQDLVLVAEKVQEVGDVALVIIDPITAYMGAGKIDTHKTADVRAVLSPLRDFADQHGVAVIGLTHPSKSVTKAMNAATGSQAFVAASRATWLFARETDEEGQETGRMLMLPVKNNLSAKRNNGLAYRLARCDLGNGMSARRTSSGRTIRSRLRPTRRSPWRWRPGASATKGGPPTSLSSFVKCSRTDPFLWPRSKPRRDRQVCLGRRSGSTSTNRSGRPRRNLASRHINHKANKAEQDRRAGCGSWELIPSKAYQAPYDQSGANLQRWAPDPMEGA